MQQSERAADFELPSRTPAHAAFEAEVAAARRVVGQEEIAARIADGIELHAGGDLHVVALHVERSDVGVQTAIEPLALRADIEAPQVLRREARADGRGLPEIETACLVAARERREHAQMLALDRSARSPAHPTSCPSRRRR